MIQFTDNIPRYAPRHVMTLRGISPVIRAVFYPIGSHPEGCPILDTYAVLELVTDNGGSRYFGCEKAWINSELRMIVQGCNSKDEIRMKWKPCRTQ